MLKHTLISRSTCGLLDNQITLDSIPKSGGRFADNEGDFLGRRISHESELSEGSTIAGTVLAAKAVLGKPPRYPEQIEVVHKYQDGSVYKGCMSRGKRCGEGLLTSPYGEKLYGTWFNDVISGRGTLRTAKGDRYDGHFLNSQISGYGKMIYMDGTVYEGEWLDGKRHGQGKLITNAGHVYEGNFEMHRLTGYGEMRFADGNVYKGQWANNKMNGFGVLTKPCGEYFEGEWLDGALTGLGIAHFNEWEYVGDFVRGSMTGHGSLISTDGTCYEGEFYKGLREGHGTLTITQNEPRVIVGLWHNNNLLLEDGDSETPLELSDDDCSYDISD
jgi:hypothetical protein